MVNRWQFVRDQRELAAQARMPARYATTISRGPAAQSLQIADSAANNAQFEAAINAAGYPAELREKYFMAKAQGNFIEFNSAVTKYNDDIQKANAAQQAQLAQFEAAVDAPGYPAELKSAYRKAKADNNFNSFNKAIEKYNADAGARAEKESAEFKAAIEREQSRAEYAKAHPGTPALSEAQAADLASKAPYMTAEQQKGAQSVIDESKRAASGVVQVGRADRPEYISRVDYDRIEADDKKNNTQFLEILQDTGISGLNAASNTYYGGMAADRESWLRDNIKSDQYLNDILVKKGEDAALTAYEKRFGDLQGIYDRWLDKNIKSEPYLNDVLAQKGEKAAIEAWGQRQKNLAEVNNRAFTQWLETAPAELRTAYETGGIDGYNTAVLEYNKVYDRAMQEVSPYISKQQNKIIVETRKGKSSEGTQEKDVNIIKGAQRFEDTIDIVQYVKDNKDVKYLKDLGVTDDDILQANKYIAYTTGVTTWTADYFKKKGWDTKLPDVFNIDDKQVQKELKEYQEHIDEAAKNYYELAPEKKPVAVLKEAAIGMVPIWGTVHYYNKAKADGLTTGEKGWLAASIAFDAISLVPVAGQFSAAARGTFMAGKAGQYISRGVQVREFGKAAAGITLAELKAPFTALAHPLQTLKAGLSPLETVVRGEVNILGKNILKAKVPLSALESKWNTMRIPINMVGGDAKTAKELRDRVTDALVHGRSNEAIVNGWKVQLNPSTLNRLGEPVAVSATPDITPFMNGAQIGKGVPTKLADGRTVIMGEGRDLYLAPTIHTRFSEANATGMIPQKPIPGGIIIRDPALIKELESSRKLYSESAEIETVIKAKKNINLGKPVQYIVSRTPSGKLLTFAVYGKRFSPTELKVLKVLGSADTLTQIFQQPVKVGRAGGKLKAVPSRITDTVQSVRASTRLPIRTVMLNTSNYSFFDNYRRLTGDTRQNITLTQDKRPPVEVKEPPRVIATARITREPVKAEARNAPEAPERSSIIGKEARRATIKEKRRLAEVPERRGTAPAERRTDIKPSGRRAVEAPERREIALTERRAPVTPPRRAAPEAQQGRTPPKPSDIRAPIKQTQRVPPQPPETRVPPNPPEKRVPPPPPRDRVPPPPPEGQFPPPKPPVRGKDKGSDTEKRKKIMAYQGGKTTYNMGKLSGKDVWWTHMDNGETIVVLGKQPEGTRILKDGPGSAEATTQRIGNLRDFKPFTIRHGAVMAHVTPSKNNKGAQNSFTVVGRSQKLGNKMFATKLGNSTGYSSKPIRRRGSRR